MISDAIFCPTIKFLSYLEIIILRGVSSIFDSYFQKRKRSVIKKQGKGSSAIKRAFESVKQEFEEHLQAINENTTEIQSNYEHIFQSDSKIDKLAERLDKIELFLQKQASFASEGSRQFDVKPLTKTEQEIFMVLYALEDDKGLVSYHDIYRRTEISENLVGNYISSMIEKGIPIAKKYFNGKPYLKLDEQFKQLQAKENILSIDPAQKVLVNY